MHANRRSFLKLTAAAATATILGYQFSFLNNLSSPLLVSGEPGVDETVDEFVPTTCWIGKQECGMLARRVNGRVVKLEGHPAHPRNRGKLCPKGQAQIISFYDPYRIKAPLKRTNAKGVHGEWTEISWEEALTLAGSKIAEVKARDPRLLIWQKGRSKAKSFYDTAFVHASGATKLHHGGFCSDAGYRAAEYTIGLHGVLHPDFRHTRYLVSWGWNMVNAGGNKLCFITWPRQFTEAKERGMKVINIDPWGRGLGPHADEWLPIKPSTDLVLFMTIANLLIQKGYVDQPYLQKHTNAPFLVKDDGYFLRVDDKEQVWDAITGSAKPHDAEGIQPELDGEFTVGGTKVKTAFRVLKEHVAGYTPEWAADICGIPAERIKSLAHDLGENAMIGSTTVLDGVSLPYRPVSIMAYHMAQQELGFQAIRAGILVFMLLGAIEAVGGLRSDFSRKIHKNFKKLDHIEIKDPPYNLYLKDSKFHPINSNNSSLAARVLLDPAKYGLDYMPEVLILHMANPAISFPDQSANIESYKKYKFVVAIDPWMSETADFFADIILPAATIEKYEGPMGVTDQYNDAVTLRIPPMKPLFQSKGDVDIYIDLCEKAGILYGEGGYIDEVNKALKLKDEYKLDLNAKPTVRDIFDRWAKSAGYEGISFFETKNISVKPIPVNKFYAPAWDPPYGGIKHRLYGESLKRYQDTMKAKGVDKIFWQDYTALPTWRTPTMEQSPREYDLTLISHKKVEFKQSRSTFVPLLSELEPEQRLEINPATARARGIEDGDVVLVESHNAVTGETRSVKVKAQYVEGVRPDTVSLSHHYGFWVHPWSRTGGPTPNTLFYSGEGYVSNTADQSFHVKVKVQRG